MNLAFHLLLGRTEELNNYLPLLETFLSIKLFRIINYMGFRLLVDLLLSTILALSLFLDLAILLVGKLLSDFNQSTMRRN